MKPRNDLQAIEDAQIALNRSTSRAMLIANLTFLWDRYLLHPAADLPKHLKP